MNSLNLTVLDSPQCWTNFYNQVINPALFIAYNGKKRTHPRWDDVVNKSLKPYGARLERHKDINRGAVIFESDDLYMLFLLRWS